MKPRVKIILFLLFSFLVTGFFVQAQNPDVRPPKTEMVSRSLEEPEGVTITHYRYQSGSSRKEIAEFYRLLFKNQGLKEIKSRGSSDNFIFFTKQEEGLTIVLTFLGPKKDGLITYSLSNHHFSLKEE